MGGFASIPLASNLPAPNIQTPAQVWQQKATLQDTQQQAQLRAQEVVDAQLKNQLQQQILKDNELAQGALNSPDPALIQKLQDRQSNASGGANAAGISSAVPQNTAANQAQTTAAPVADLAEAESPQSYQGSTSAAPIAAPPVTQGAPSPAVSQPTPLGVSSSPSGSVDNRANAIWNSTQMSLPGKIRWMNQLADTQKRISENKELDTKVIAAHNNRYVGLIDGLLQIGDPAQQAAQYPVVRDQAIKEGLPGAESLPRTLQEAGGISGLVQQRNMHMLHSDFANESDKLGKIEKDGYELAGQTIGIVSKSADPAAAYHGFLAALPWQIRGKLPQTWGPGVEDIVKNTGLSIEQQNKLPGEQATTDEKTRANIGAQFNGATGNAADYTRAFDALNKPDQARLTKLGLNPEKFDVATFPDRINKYGLSANENRQANYQDTEAKLRQQASDIAQQRADTADRRADIAERNSSFMHERLEKLTHGAITQQQYINDLRTHDDLTHKENKAWADRQSYNEIINSKNGDKVPDPKNPGDTTKQVVSTPAVRDAYREKADAAGSEAIAHHNTAYELRKRLGGELGERYSVPTPVQRETGQFAKPAAQPTAKPAAATPETPPKTASAPVSAPPKSPSKQVVVNLGNGKYLTFPNQDAADAASKKYNFTITHGNQ